MEELGITEACWNSMTEDEKLAYKFIFRMTLFLPVYAIEKVGVEFIDLGFTIACYIFTMLLIEVNRSYSKFKHPLSLWSRKAPSFLLSLFSSIAVVLLILSCWISEISNIKIKPIAALPNPLYIYIISTAAISPWLLKMAKITYTAVRTHTNKLFIGEYFVIEAGETKQMFLFECGYIFIFTNLLAMPVVTIKYSLDLYLKLNL